MSTELRFFPPLTLSRCNLLSSSQPETLPPTSDPSYQSMDPPLQMDVLFAWDLLGRD